MKLIITRIAIVAALCVLVGLAGRAEYQDDLDYQASLKSIPKVSYHLSAEMDQSN